MHPALCWVCDYLNVTWTPRRLNSPITRLFVENLSRLTTNKWSTSLLLCVGSLPLTRHGVIKWKYFPRYWPFVWGIHRSPVNSPHNGQWRGASVFSLMCDWISGWVNNRAHYDVTVMTVSPHRGLLMRKTSPCHGINILNWYIRESSLKNRYHYRDTREGLTQKSWISLTFIT